MVVAAVAMITSFRSDIGNGGSTTTNETTDVIISIHLADYSDEYSKHNDDCSVKTFEYIANDGSTSDNNNISIADTPGNASEL